MKTETKSTQTNDLQFIQEISDTNNLNFAPEQIADLQNTMTELREKKTDEENYQECLKDGIMLRVRGLTYKYNEMQQISDCLEKAVTLLEDATEEDPHEYDGQEIIKGYCDYDQKKLFQDFAKEYLRRQNELLSEINELRDSI